VTVSAVDYTDAAVRVRVPASSGNLGPGFDSFGLALALYDEVTAHATDDGLLVEVAGEGAERLPCDEDHLVVKAMRTTFERLGGQPPGLRLQCRNAIPQSRGLGSSAAAIVAGIVAARGLRTDGARLLGGSELLELAAALEGHPDNVAACLSGGFTVAWTEPSGPRSIRLQVHPDIRVVAYIPRAEVSTQDARALLPAHVPHREAVANASRAALLIVAMTSRPELLVDGTRDWLHQQYRATAMPASLDLVGCLRESGAAAVVSGAGPAVLALTADANAAAALAEQAPVGWRALRLGVEPEGARTRSW
jgi:homoserine kinase